MSRAGRGWLAQVDDRAVPALGRGLRGIGRAGRGAGAALGRATGPAGRWVRGFAGRQPTVLAALALVAAAAILWVATGGNHPKSLRPLPAAVLPPPAGGALGPDVGVSVDSYLAAAAQRRQQIVALPPDQQLGAVVDLNGYLSPTAISSLLAAEPNVAIESGYARVAPPQNADVHVLTVGVGGDLAAQLAQDQHTARRLLSRYALAVEARAAHPLNRRVRDLVATLDPQVPAARIDAKGLGPDCGCVFALVVTGPVGELERIAGLTDVRVLDPAPPGSSIDNLRIVPLEPQVTDVVEPLQFAGLGGS